MDLSANKDEMNGMHINWLACRNVPLFVMLSAAQVCLIHAYEVVLLCQLQIHVRIVWLGSNMHPTCGSTLHT